MIPKQHGFNGSVEKTAVNRVHVILALGLVAIGLVLVFDALSSHALEWPLGLFVLVVGVIWLVGRIAFSATQPSRRNGGLPIRHLVGEFVRVSRR